MQPNRCIAKIEPKNSVLDGTDDNAPNGGAGLNIPVAASKHKFRER